MKTRNIVYLIPILTICIGCKSKSKISADDINARTIKIEFMEQYCGGAEPTEEVMNELSQIRPYANESVYISNFNDGRNFSGEKEVKLDKAGMVTLSLDTGIYVVSMYKLELEVMVEEDKAEPDKTQDVEPNEPNEPNNAQMIKDECEKQWKRMNIVPLKIIGGKSAYHVVMNKECNPCEEPRP